MFLYSFLNEKQESKKKVDLWTLKQNRRSITGHSQIWGEINCICICICKCI